MQSKPKAYSYIRISSKRQLDGDGLARQLRDAREWADEHNLDLDEQLQDVGSGYHGKHVKFGALGGFLKLVEQGKIPIGSTLIVESLDRLSREDVLTAQGQFIDILVAGITIVTLIDKQVYYKGKDDTQLILSLSYMSRANNESSEKSVRAKKTIRKRKMAALEGAKRYNHHLARWIDQTRIGETKDYEFTLNDHADTIKRIYDMADSGMGAMSIARQLNLSKTPILRAKTNKNEHWSDATILMILRDETAIGTYSVYERVDGQKVLLGDPIKNYYPAAVDENVYWRVQRNRPVSTQMGRVGKAYTNLFPRNTSCSQCGRTLRMVYGGVNQKRKYMTCSQRYIGGIKCENDPKMFRYDELEAAILEYATDFHKAASDIMQVQTFDAARIQKTLDAAEAKLAEYDTKYKTSVAAISEEPDVRQRALMRELSYEARERFEKQQSFVAELRDNLREAADSKKELASVSERIQMERLKWTTLGEEELIKSRTRVGKALAEFITTVEVNFNEQTATVYIAGYTSAYTFDNAGNLKRRDDILKMFMKQPPRHKLHYTPTGRIAKIEQIVPEPLSEAHLTTMMRGMDWNETKIAHAVKAWKSMMACLSLRPHLINRRI